MATGNPFDLLGDDDSDDPSQLIAAQKLIISSKKAQTPTQAQSPKPAGKLPSKPLPPAQAVREAKTETGRGGGRGVGRGFGRDRGRSGTGGGFNRDTATENSFGSSVISGVQSGTEELDTWKPSERRSGYGGPHGSSRGGRRGAFSNEEDGNGERPRRVFERHSGTGRGNGFKREGFGQGNWGNPGDEIPPVAEEVVNEDEKKLGAEKPSGEKDNTDDNKENPAKEEEKEPKDKEMTLEEYEKVMEEKRKALQAPKTEERKVDGKEFATMQQLSSKKGNDIFVKLGSDKEKRKEFSDKDDKFKKPVSINEFLKPAKGEMHFNPGGRARGRGRGSGSGGGGYGGGGTSIPMSSNVAAPKIEDPGQFPTLGAK